MRFRTLFTKRGIALICILVGGVFLAQPNIANAFCLDAVDCVNGILSAVLGAMIQGLGYVLTQLVSIFNWAIHFRLDTDIYVINYGWGIVRDFANMLFIIALIVMAFATIFDFAQYNLRSLIGKFLIAALLINFSLVIGGMIIRATDTVSQVFLASIGNSAERIGQALSPQTIINLPKPAPNLLIVQEAMSIFMFLIIDIGLFVATVVAFARIPILSILLIFAPLAWVLGILPSTREGNQMWWKQFLGWNLFLPIFLLFLYFGMFFFAHQADFLEKISPQVAGGTFLEGLGFSIQILFYYFMAGFIFVGGTGMALSGAFGIGGGAASVARWARQGALDWTGITSAGRAAKMRAEQFKKEGLSGAIGKHIYGGEKGVEERTTKFARQLGVKDAEFKLQKDFISDVDKWLAVLKDRESTGKLSIDDAFRQKAYGAGADSVEGAAMRALLYERGTINEEQFEKDMDLWLNGDKLRRIAPNPLMAEKMSERAKKAKYKQVRAEKLLAMASAEGPYEKYKTARAVTTRREWFNFLKEEKGNDEAFEKMTSPQLKIAMDLFGGNGTNEAESFRKTVANKRPDIAAEYDHAYGGEKVKGKGVVENIKNIIGKKKPNEIADMLTESWETGEFQAALEDHLFELDRESPPRTTPTGKIIKPGGGQQFKGSLENAVRGNKKKMHVLEKITSVESVFMPGSGAEPEESPKTPPPSSPPPTATGASYREIRGGNVIDLRGIAKPDLFDKDES